MQNSKKTCLKIYLFFDEVLKFIPLEIYLFWSHWIQIILIFEIFDRICHFYQYWFRCKLHDKNQSHFLAKQFCWKFYHIEKKLILHIVKMQTISVFHNYNYNFLKTHKMINFALKYKNSSEVKTGYKRKCNAILLIKSNHVEDNPYNKLKYLIKRYDL